MPGRSRRVAALKRSISSKAASSFFWRAALLDFGASALRILFSTFSTESLFISAMAILNPKRPQLCKRAIAGAVRSVKQNFKQKYLLIWINKPAPSWSSCLVPRCPFVRPPSRVTSPLKWTPSAEASRGIPRGFLLRISGCMRVSVPLSLRMTLRKRAAKILVSHSRERRTERDVDLESEMPPRATMFRIYLHRNILQTANRYSPSSRSGSRLYPRQLRLPSSSTSERIRS